MKLSRGIFTATLAFVFCANSFSLEVDEKELETVSTQPVVFENYNGPHSVINSAAEIAGIGTDLGKLLQTIPKLQKMQALRCVTRLFMLSIQKKKENLMRIFL